MSAEGSLSVNGNTGATSETSVPVTPNASRSDQIIEQDDGQHWDASKCGVIREHKRATARTGGGGMKGVGCPQTAQGRAAVVLPRGGSTV